MKYSFSALLTAVTILLSFQLKSEVLDTLGKDLIYLKNVHVIGNKVTKRWVIDRELSLVAGDSMTGFELVNNIKISKQNLINTSLFNFVDTRYVMLDSKNVEVYIVLTERWYVWPIPVFELAETNLNSWWENKDFSRINYGVNIKHKNFRGRNEEFDVLFQFGFTQLLALEYSIPFINKAKTLGVALKTSYGQNHEVNYTSSQNERQFYKDVDEIQQRNITSNITFNYRRRFFSKHLFSLGYNQVDVTDSVLILNPDYLMNNQEEMKYFDLSYRYIYDKRDNKNYALHGRFASGTITKFGLGLFENPVDLWWIKLEYKHYWKLTKRLFPAFMTQFHLYMNEDQPYYLRDGMGYTDKSTIRSYELYVIDAQQFGIAKFQLRYQLVPPKQYNFGFIPINKFKKIHISMYAGIFGDIGYANDRYGYPSNDMANSLQYGSGFSLDIASYYDVVFRAEYSFNKFGEHGIFLHFVAPI